MKSGSPLADWFNYPFNHSEPLNLPQLQPCTYQGERINCSDICLRPQPNDSLTQSLWDPSTPSNLVTCGLYWTVSLGFFDHYGTFGNYTTEALEAFNPVGLDLPALTLTPAKVPDLDCFRQIDLNLHDLSSGSACNPNLIFPHFNVYSYYDGKPSGPLPCFEELCSPSGDINPDIGGIGVFASLIMQTGIAFFAFLILYAMDWSYTRSVRQGHQIGHRKHFEAWVTALVEFHKAQCFFSAAIQIAAVVYFFFTYRDTPTGMSANSLFTTATSSSVPVILTLIAVHRYGQPSWYLTLLSVCCFLLSILPLGVSYNGIARQNPRDMQYPSCGSHSAGELLHTWCPPHTPVPRIADAKDLYTDWNWVLWANCLVWMLLCIVDKAAAPDPITRGKVEKALSKAATKIRFWQTTNKVSLLVYKALFLVTWTLSVGYQLYTYILYFQYNYVKTEWSFGQVIALTAWLPCLAELLHLERIGVTEGSRYRLPKGFAVLREVVFRPALVRDDDNSSTSNANPPRQPNGPKISPPEQTFLEGGSDISLRRKYGNHHRTC